MHTYIYIYTYMHTPGEVRLTLLIYECQKYSDSEDSLKHSYIELLGGGPPYTLSI
jgi:hypothetical protein